MLTRDGVALVVRRLEQETLDPAQVEDSIATILRAARSKDEPVRKEVDDYLERGIKDREGDPFRLHRMMFVLDRLLEDIDPRVRERYGSFAQRALRRSDDAIRKLVEVRLRLSQKLSSNGIAIRN